MANNKVKHDYSKLRKEVEKEIKIAVKEGASSGYVAGIVEGLSERLAIVLDGKNLDIDVTELAQLLTDSFAEVIHAGTAKIAKEAGIEIDLSDIIRLNDSSLLSQIEDINNKIKKGLYESEEAEQKAVEKLVSSIQVARKRNLDLSFLGWGEDVFSHGENEFQEYFDIFVKDYEITQDKIEKIDQAIVNSMTLTDQQIESVVDDVFKNLNKKNKELTKTYEFVSSLQDKISSLPEGTIKRARKGSDGYDEISTGMVAKPAIMEFWNQIKNNYDELDDSIKELLKDSGLLNESLSGFDVISDGANNFGGIIGSENILKFVEYTDEAIAGTVRLQQALDEAAQEGVNCARILEVVPVGETGLVAELQSRVQGTPLQNSDFEYSLEVLKASDEQIQNLFLDLKKLYDLGVQGDVQNLSNFLFDPIKGIGIIDTDISGGYESFEEEYKLLLDTIKSIPEELSETLEPGQESEKIIKEWADFGNRFETVLSNLIESGFEAIRTVQDSHSPSVEAGEVADNVVDGYANSLEAGTEKVKEAASDLAEAAMDALKEGSEEVNTKVLDFYKEFGTPSQALDSGTFANYRELLDYLGGRFAEMNEEAEDFSEIKLNNEFFKDLVRQLDIADDKLTDLTTLFYDLDRVQPGGDWVQLMGRFNATEQAGIDLRRIQEIIDANGILQKQLEDSRDEVDRLENEVGELEDRLTGSISGTFAEELKEENIELREELAATRNEADGFLEVLDNLRNRVELLENDIVRQHPGELVDTTRIEEILGKIDELETKVKESSESSKSAIINSEWAERMVDDLQEQIDELKEAKDQFKNAGGELVNSFAEGANTYKENIAQVFGEISDAGLEAIRDNNEAFFTAGRQHGSEYVSGIEDYLTTAGDRVAEAVGRIASETSNINLSKNDIVKTQESSIPEVTKDIEQVTKAEQKFELMVINSNNALEWQAKQIQQAFYNDVGIKNEKTVKDIQLEAEQLESIITEYREATEAKKEFVEVESSKKQEKIDASASADSIKKESQALDELEKDAEKAAEGKKKVTKENKELKKAADDTTKSTNEETEAVKKLAKQIDRSKLAEKIKSFLLKNPKTPNDLKRELKDMIDTLNDKSIKVSTDRLNRMRLRLQEVSNEVTNLGKKGSTWFDKLGKKFGEFTRYLATQVSFYKIVDIARQGVSTVIELDTALTELRKVSDATEERLTQSFSKSAETARELGQTISDVIGITADWSRLGYDIGDAEELARVTTLFTTVGDNMTAEDASSYLISTLQGYQMAADEAGDIVDKFNNVANNMAIDTKGIGEALQRSAASFNAANTDLSKSIALITATNTVVQNPESVGTLWKTLSARIRGGFAPIYKEIYNPQTCKKYAA